MDFFISITSYKREKNLKSLLKQINDQKGHYKIGGVILIDKCDYGVISHEGFEVLRFKEHYGRKRFYELMNIAFDKMKQNNFKYYINLQDDIILRDNFFSKCAYLWENIKDDKKIILDLRNDERAGSSLWGSYPVNVINFNKELYYKSQWFDLVFMSDHKIKEYMPKLYYVNMDSSSGVARQITKRFRKNGLNMYHYSKTLVHHGHCESLMNPEIRKKEKLIC